MTLDENPYAEPEWIRVARLQEAEERAQYRADLLVRDACESIEAEEAHWVGVMRQMPPWMRDIHYQQEAG